MLDVLLEVILPVLAVALVGGAVCRRLGIGAETMSPLSFFLFSPALVFTSMSTIELGGTETVRIALVAAGGAVAVSVLGFAVSTVLGHDVRTRAAVALTAGMSNGGNLGLPVSALAFGAAGLAVAVVAFVTGALVVNTVGVLVASSADGSVGGAFRSVLGVPSLWAAVAGLAVNGSGIDLPALIAESSATLGDAAIPVMLVVLGLQLRRDADTGGLPEVGLSVGLRLLAGPAVALGLATALGLGGTTRDTLVVLGGMPAAVYTTILATQYGTRPPLVTRTVVIGTLASMVTLTALIARYR